ncbi:MAG: hypothetical protein KF824_09495 [Fimbriimonadaceae bacterium]|nr:MAG: hypothetical protein KF824_09495 [Fimbriimonadaceae bacterium]
MVLSAVFGSVIISGLQLQTHRQFLIPDEPLTLGGYTERGDKITTGGDPLFAQIAILNDGKTKVALVAFEGLTVPESLYREVSRRLPGLPIMLVATHTHSAPDTQMLNDRMTFRIPGIATYKKRWLDWYALRIAGGISIAQQSVPQNIKNLTLQESVSTFARSRRKETTVSNRLIRLSGDSHSILTVFGAHGTCFEADNLETNGDWLGALMRLDSGLVWPGAIGNASPNVGEGTGQERSEWMAMGLNRERTPVRPLKGNLRFLTEPIELDKPTPHPEFAKSNGLNETLANIVVLKFAPQEAHISALQVGDCLFIGVPGEPSEELERMIVASAKKQGFSSAVISHCNGWMGYLLSPIDYDRGGYEATLMLYGRESGLRVVQAAERVIRRFSSKSLAE